MSAIEPSPSAEPAIDVEPEGPRRVRPRRCVASRSPHARDALVRFVIGPDDRLIPDVDARLPGRGLWLSVDAESLKTAVARNLFQKAARRRVVVDPQLASRLDGQLLERCLQGLGLARRAGLVLMGYEQVVAAAKAGDLAVVVVASDAGADGVAKVTRASADVGGWVQVLDRTEIGRALGRDELVYVGIRAGGLTRRLLVDATRLARLRDEPSRVRTAALEMIETA